MSAETGGPRRSAVRPLVQIALLALVAYAGWVAARGYWQQTEAQRQIAQAYAFVTEHGDVTSYLPCFCGCGKREGHASLDSCFVSRRDDAGRVVARDDHAETCRVCVEVALDAAHMLKEGASVLDIRRAVELKHRNLHPLRTDTPEPPQHAVPAAGSRAR
jgi:hypothetical protein